MWHSVKEIGYRYENLSIRRKDKIRFNAKDFLQFAKDNQQKYNLIEDYGMLKVSTWHSNDLINDFNKQKMKQ